MKILYVTTISNTVNAFLVPHIKMLVNQGHQVDVAFNKKQRPNKEIQKLGCKIHQIEFERIPLHYKNFKSYKKLKELVINNNYELIHTHTPVASLLTRYACRNIPQIKVIYTAHGFHFFKGSSLTNWLLFYPLEKLAAYYTDALIAINKEDYEIAVKMKNRRLKDIFQISGIGIDYSKFSSLKAEDKMNLRKKYKYSPNDFILFYAAEFNKNKNQKFLIDVIDIVKDTIPNIKLVLAGDGPLLKKCQDYITEKKLNEYIHTLGYREDIANLFSITDVAVSSSRREGLPVNILEAMAFGLPIIVSNCRGNRDLIENGENGFVIDLYDKKAYAESVKKLYISSEKRQEFGILNSQKVKLYSIDTVVEELMEIYSNYT